METNINAGKGEAKLDGADVVGRLWEESWTYIKTVVDVVRQPVLILNKELCVMAANEAFYRTFQVEQKDTEKTLVYKLGNGQWDIPALRRLLEEILPKNTFFRSFEVAHDFPVIGRKVIMLNARQIHPKEELTNGKFPPIILLAMEDVTEMMIVAETLAGHANQLDAKFSSQTQKLEKHITVLEKEIVELKARK
jgi:nitrogen-specific signal transduction histidine kinase